MEIQCVCPGEDLGIDGNRILSHRGSFAYRFVRLLHSPSPGRVPRSPGVCPPTNGLHSITGPMARNVPDLALFMDAMQGSQAWHGAYESTAVPPRVSFQKAVSERRTRFLPKRVGFSPDLGGICHVRGKVHADSVCTEIDASTQSRDSHCASTCIRVYEMC